MHTKKRCNKIDFWCLEAEIGEIHSPGYCSMNDEGIGIIHPYLDFMCRLLCTFLIKKWMYVVDIGYIPSHGVE